MNKNRSLKVRANASKEGIHSRSLLHNQRSKKKEMKALLMYKYLCQTKTI